MMRVEIDFRSLLIPALCALAKTTTATPSFCGKGGTSDGDLSATRRAVVGISKLEGVSKRSQHHFLSLLSVHSTWSSTEHSYFQALAAECPCPHVYQPSTQADHLPSGHLRNYCPEAGGPWHPFHGQEHLVPRQGV